MKIAVIGAGPAGAYLSYLLARSGLSPVLFDGSHPREKVCGGILSPSFFSDFPIFDSFTLYQSVSCDHFYTTPKNQSFKIDSSVFKDSYRVISRKSFDLYLTEKAVKAGAVWVQEHIRDVRRLPHTWEVITQNGKTYEVDFIVGADGANSLVRKKTIGKFQYLDYGIGMGYRFPRQKDYFMHTVVMNKGLMGFILPGYNQTLVIAGFKRGTPFSRKDLDHFCSKFFKNNTPFNFFSGIQPFPSHPDFFLEPRSGKDFLLIGDAAGFCNPKNGEGIRYALKSAEAAASVLLSSRPLEYESQWKNLFGHELVKAADTLQWFPFIPVLEFCALLFSRSPSLTALAYHLAKGELFHNSLLKSHFHSLLRSPLEILKGHSCNPPVS